MILYEAKCIAGTVFLINGLKETPVPDCKILGTGKAPESSGILIADQNRFWYVPLITPNVISIVDELIKITDNLNKTLDVLKQSGTLIDNASTAAGIAAFVPSVVTGTKMATDATTISSQVIKISQELQELKLNIV